MQQLNWECTCTASVILNTFAAEDQDTVINQLVFRSQGDLQQFVDDRNLFIRMVGEIMTEFNLQRPPFTGSSRLKDPGSWWSWKRQQMDSYFLGTSTHWTAWPRPVEGSWHVNPDIAPCWLVEVWGFRPFVCLFLCLWFGVGRWVKVVSVAMASLRSIWSFHCKGRPGVILGSPKEQQDIPFCAILWSWTLLPRYWRCLLHWKCNLRAMPSLCWNLWFTLLHRLFRMGDTFVMRAGLGSSWVAQSNIFTLQDWFMCKQGRPGVIPGSQVQIWWAERYLCVLDPYVFAPRAHFALELPFPWWAFARWVSGGQAWGHPG